MKSRSIPSNQLTMECWTVQFQGVSACVKCEFKDTEDCGGKRIRETEKNSRGFKVPLGVEL